MAIILKRQLTEPEKEHVLNMTAQSGLKKREDFGRWVS